MRLVPFSVFLIVPFMELLLPVALKLFPNMLPSTFEDKFAEEEKKRKLLKMRLEMAKFLQETIEESGIPGSQRAEAVKEFGDFFRKVRTTGEQASTDELIRVAKLFHDELTLDNLSRPQLVSMCRYMNLNAFGTDNFLRYQIRNKMHSIKQDDKVTLLSRTQMFEGMIFGLDREEVVFAQVIADIFWTTKNPSISIPRNRKDFIFSGTWKS